MGDSLVMVQVELDLIHNLNWKLSSHIIYVHIELLNQKFKIVIE